MKSRQFPRVIIASPDAARRARWGQELKELSVHQPADLNDLQRSLTDLKPDILLLDLSLPGLHGTKGISAVQRFSPSTKILLLTKHLSEPEGRSMLEAGVKGYCNLDIDPALLKKAVMLVQRGEIWVSRKFISQLLEALVSVTEAQQAKALKARDVSLDVLTPREREIVGLLGGGASNKEIANQLNVTEKTVKAHFTSIFRKLGIPDRLHLALFINGHRLAR
jgi:DNA-binding NarL/FixJ family response regulator